MIRGEVGFWSDQQFLRERPLGQLSFGTSVVKLACIVLAHRAPRQLSLLLSRLRHRNLQIYLHLDAKTPTRPFREVLARATADETVVLRRRRSRWGGAEVVDATIEGLARALDDGCNYFILISGQDLPLKSPTDIIDCFEAAPSTSYIEYWPLPDPRWRYGGRDRIEFYSYNIMGRRETCIPPGEDLSSFNYRGRALNSALRIRERFQPQRHFPPYVLPVGGRQWWNLSFEAVRYVLGFLDDHPDYRRYHDYTILPDELFFQSILVGTDFARRVEIVNDTMRFMIWDPGSDHPRTLAKPDLPSLLASDKPFARKFDLDVDSDVVTDLLERLP